MTWSKIKRDLEVNRDPDYDSDEEEAWSHDLLCAYQCLSWPGALLIVDLSAIPHSATQASHLCQSSNGTAWACDGCSGV